MTRIFTVLGALLACGTAWADGPIVRWDRIEGVSHDAVGTEVAGIASTTRGVTVGSGTAMFNLRTGFLFVQVKGIAYDRHYPANARPIGTYPGGLRMATIVCDSTGMFGTPVIVDTPAVQVTDGDLSYTGFVPVPLACSDRPDQIVLLIRIAGPGMQYGHFFAYGAAPAFQ